MTLKPMAEFEPHKTKIVMHSNECVHHMIKSDKCSNIKCEKIEMVQQYKYLGVIIDRYLRWSLHTEYVEKKIRTVIPAIYTLRNYVNKSTLKMVYYALVESRLRYGIQAWGSASKTYLEKIDRLQKKCLRLITREEKKSVDELLKEENVLNARGLFLMTKTREYLTVQENKIEIAENKQTNYMLRKTLKYKIPVKRTKYGEQTSEYIITKILNQLPVEILQEKNTRKLKGKIKTWLLTENIMSKIK